MASRRKNGLAPAVGFAPILPQRARILILGTLPSVASLAAQQYYAHPRNAFWPILGALLGFEAAAPYESRTAKLRQRGVGLWDVCQSARRPGSLDAAIDQQSLRANDIVGLLAGQSSIRAVFFNGASAARLYHKFIVPAPAGRDRQLPHHTLPSTSPAHASMNTAQKQQAWSRILEYLTDREA